jgi:hypothetical protein
MPVVGKTTPKLYSNKGLIPVDSSVSPLIILAKIDSVNQPNGLNVVGGDKIVFTGSNLPRDITTSIISLVFSNGLKTECKPVKLTSTELTCETERFDYQTDLA